MLRASESSIPYTTKDHGLPAPRVRPMRMEKPIAPSKLDYKEATSGPVVSCNDKAMYCEDSDDLLSKLGVEESSETFLRHDENDNLYVKEKDTTEEDDGLLVMWERMPNNQKYAIYGVVIAGAIFYYSK